jgi:hypothetical protein
MELDNQQLVLSSFHPLRENDVRLLDDSKGITTRKVEKLKSFLRLNLKESVSSTTIETIEINSIKVE